jgi:D-alanyl-D-alanine carboxypeptidase
MLPVVTALLLTALQAAAPAPADTINAAAKAALAERHIPGMSVVVLRGDQVVWSRGYGVREVGGAGDVTADTVFQLGSISKQFLAALALKLADDGRLSPDAAVTKYLPEFTLLTPAVRVRHLLNHTSGIRELFSQQAYLDGIEDLTRGVPELVAIARASPVDFEPGSRWAYSNTAYAVLALVIERVTGKPYEDALAEHVFRPLDLRTMRQCTPLPAEPGEARGHVRRAGVVSVAAPENMHWIRGDGGICGSASDLAHWTRLLATGRVVSRSSYARMTAPTPVRRGGPAPYGFALSLIRPDGVAKVAHGGAMLGYTAMAAYYPASQLTIVVLTNRGGAGADAIERRIARGLLGIDEPSRAVVPLTDAERARVAGVYDIGPFAITLVERDGALTLEAPPPGPTTRLTHHGGGRFTGDADSESIELLFQAGSPSPSVRLMMGAMYWYGERR